MVEGSGRGGGAAGGLIESFVCLCLYFVFTVSVRYQNNEIMTQVYSTFCGKVSNFCFQDGYLHCVRWGKRWGGGGGGGGALELENSFTLV